MKIVYDLLKGRLKLTFFTEMERIKNIIMRDLMKRENLFFFSKF